MVNKILTCCLIVLVPVLGAKAEKPDTLKILFIHSSVGQYMLSEAGYNNKYNWKVIADSVGDSIGWPVLVYDYRANTEEGASWGGWRDEKWDSTDYSSAALGNLIHYSFGITALNMWPHHVESLWTEGKEEIFYPYTIYDTAAPGDTFCQTTDYDVIWWKSSYYWYGTADEHVEDYRSLWLSIRDSMALGEYNDKIFVLGIGSPLNGSHTASTYLPDSSAIAAALALDTFLTDTLQNLDSFPNFFVCSFYRYLYERDPASSDWGLLQDSCKQVADHHPNRAGSRMLMDSCRQFLIDMMDAIDTYWDSGNQSDDSIPPAQINDLGTTTNPQSTSVSMFQIMPGVYDDKVLASIYDIRYSTSHIYRQLE
jgi:hypothetical protein